jgi:hypothetical protein
MRVHFIKKEHFYEIEDAVNTWIQEHTEVEIVDIKYSAVPWYSSPEYSVMIIYR